MREEPNWVGTGTKVYNNYTVIQVGLERKLEVLVYELLDDCRGDQLEYQWNWGVLDFEFSQKSGVWTGRGQRIEWHTVVIGTSTHATLGSSEGTV